MSTSTNRAPFRTRPCKKQESPNTPSPPKSITTPTDPNIQNNNLRNNTGVNLYLNNSHSSSSLTAPVVQQPSNIIKAALQAHNHVTWNAKLKETTKSSVTQRKISEYFRSIATPTNPTVSTPLPTEYLPSQRLFKLASTIRRSDVICPKMHASQTQAQKQDHSSMSPAKSPSSPSPSDSSSSHQSQRQQSDLEISSHEGSKELEVIFRHDEFQYSNEESKPSTITSEKSSADGSSFIPSVHLLNQPSVERNNRRITRSTHHTNLVPSQISISIKSPKPPLPPLSINSTNRSTETSQDRSIVYKSFPSQANILREKEKSSSCQTLSKMLNNLAAQCETYKNIQEEINTRQSYIDERIQRLSPPSNKPDNLLHNTVPTTFGSNFKTDRPPFKYLNYSGSKDDDTYRSTCTSPINMSSSSPSRVPEQFSSSNPSSISSYMFDIPNSVKENQKEKEESKFRFLNYAGNKDDNTFNSSCTSSIPQSHHSSTSSIPDLEILPTQDTPVTSPSVRNKPCRSNQPMVSSFPKSSPPADLPTTKHTSADTSPLLDVNIEENPPPQHHPDTISISTAKKAHQSEIVLNNSTDSDSSYASSSEEEEELEFSDEYDPQGSKPSVILTPLHLAEGVSNLVQRSTPSHENPEVKSKESIRIISQNCRGVFHKGVNASDVYAPSMESFQMYSPDLILLNETNTDWFINDNAYETKLINKAVWSPLPTSTYVASCKWTNLRKTNYQPGGVMSVALDKLTSRIKSNFRDPYGRWIKLTFQAKNHSIAIYNVYRPNTSSVTSAGIETIWMQQWVLMKNENPDVDPRKQCIIDLITSIQEGHEKGEIPVVIGDFNEDLKQDKGFGIKDLMSLCGLRQAFKDFHGSIPSSRMNNRSVYHFFVSKCLLSHIDRLGVLNHTEGFHQSDHIPFFLDFNKEVFEAPLLSITPPDFRKLRMHDAPGIEKYICHCKDQFNHHNILQRVLNLREYVKKLSFDKTAEKELEKLDEQITNIRIRSENRLLPDPSRFKHTTKMDDVVHKIRILQSIVKLLKNKKDSSNLAKYALSLNIKESSIQNQKSTLAEIKNLKEELKFLHEEEDIVREDHLDLCYDKAVELHDTKKASIIKNMKEREKQKRSWSKIQFTVQKIKGSNISRLGIPVGYEHRSTKEIWTYLSDHNNQPTWTFITDKEEIDKRIWEWQYLHYSQAGETPLASPVWRDKLDPVVKSDSEMNEVMQGDIFEQSDLPAEAKTFLKHLTSNIQPEMSKADTSITKLKFQAFYKGAKESTSSSPSKLHLGHWKAAALDDDISTVLAIVIDLAVSNSYTLKRWQKVIGVMLEKVHGQPRIHKFRTIHLVESDFNFVLRAIWGKSFMAHNEKSKSLHPNQYGGRKGIQGQSAAINKVLTMDIIRHYAEPAALLDNDAQACYDRLIPVLLSYALIRLGLPKHLTRFMCKWLQSATYHIKLAHGVSEHSYQTTLDTYLFGTGQGTGWSPPNWGAISDIISNAMEENSPGMFLTHPNRTVFSNRCYDAFVDDVNGGLTSDGMYVYQPPYPTSVPLMNTIYEQIQRNVEYYARLLFTSGGKLALHKCYCYILEFEWKNGTKKMKNTADTLDPITVDQTFTGKPQSIQLINPTEARKMLGIIAAPDGNAKQQYESLLQKAKKWGDQMKYGYLNRFDVTMGLRQGICKVLEYPVGVALLNETQCKKIMSPVIMNYLKKMGIKSTISRQIVYGPCHYGGLAVPDLFTSQGIQKIQLFLGHKRKNDKTSTILTVAQGTLQQEIGISSPILQSKYEEYGILASPSWMNSLWFFLSTISASIKETETWCPSPVYTNDTNIMEKVMKWGYSPQLNKDINLCRLFLKLYYVGDMLDTSTTKIKSKVLNFEEENYHQDKFPLIPALPKRYKEIWLSTLRRLLQESPIGTRLGAVVSLASFEWFMSEDKLKVYQRVGDQYEMHNKLESPSINLTFDKTCSATFEKIQKYYAVTAIIKENLIIIKYPLRLQTATEQLHDDNTIQKSPSLSVSNPTQNELIPSTPIRKSFLSYMEDLPNSRRRMIGKVTFDESHIHKIVQAIQQNKCMGVGDASVRAQLGGHSYVIETIPAKYSITGVGPVDCMEEDITSNRGEGYTVLSMLYILDILCKCYSITTGSATLYCDNKEALRRRDIYFSTYTKLTTRDTDVKMEMELLITNLPIKISLEHVPGHADSEPNFVYARAPQSVQRNIDMHNKVTAFMKHPPPSIEPRSVTPFLPAQQAALLIHGEVISGDIKTHITNTRHGSVMENRLLGKLKIPQRFQHVIDWPAITLAMKKKNPAERVSVTKIMHQLWPTQVEMCTRKDGSTHQCLRCDLAPETFNHIFQCQCRLSKSAFRSSIETFRKTLHKLKAAKPIIDVFVEYLVSFGQSRSPKPPIFKYGGEKAFSLLLRAHQHQRLLSQSVFHLGYISYKWSLVQGYYTRNAENPKTSAEYNLSWSASIIKAIWTFSHSLWQKRCAQVHTKNKDIEESMHTEELKSSIQSYLRTPRDLLSSHEKLLHLNVAKHLKSAFPTTLARWLNLLSTEREKSIRLKRNERIQRGGLQPLTKYFRWRASINEGNI